MKRIERDKNRISAFRAVLSATGMLALMGCGKTVVDTTVEQQPTQTIETTIDDPVVDVPVVEPTTDVSDNTTVEPEEDEFADATFIQTGEHEYTINLDCPDNSNAPEVSNAIANTDSMLLEGGSSISGISENLMVAVMTYGSQIDSTNPACINFEAWADKPYTINLPGLGPRTYCITADLSLYDRPMYTEDMLRTDANGELPASAYNVCGGLIHECVLATNGNVSCGIGMYLAGPDVWNRLMQQCMDANNLTADEIYAKYDANFVYQFDESGLVDHNNVNDVMQYIGNDEITITTFNSETGEEEYVTTYSVERAKA